MGSSQSFDIHGDDVFAAMGRRKKTVVLERRNEFPERLRCAIEKASLDEKSSRNPTIFLSRIQDEFQDWLFEAALPNEDSCRGLDDERDTEQQVELALRFFPRVLCHRRYGLFPIFWLTKSTRSVSFIPLFARLGAELGLFRESERGGLVFGTNGMDVFSQLAATATTRACGESAEPRQEVVDAKFLAVIEKLREAKLMRRSDICRYKMIDILCHQSFFPEQRFRYLVDWCPSALLSNYGRGKIKTISVRLITRFFDKDDISGIRMLFELSMKYYPAELGFLFDTIYTVDDEKKPSSFRKKPIGFSNSNSNSKRNRRFIVGQDNDVGASEDNLPPPLENSITSLFEFACDTYGKKEVQRIVDKLLFLQMTKDTNFTRKAVVRAAASCEPSDNGAESIFLLMQRDPTLLQLNPAIAVRKPGVPRRPKSIVARTA